MKHVHSFCQRDWTQSVEFKFEISTLYSLVDTKFPPTVTAVHRPIPERSNIQDAIRKIPEAGIENPPSALQAIPPLHPTQSLLSPDTSPLPQPPSIQLQHLRTTIIEIPSTIAQRAGPRTTTPLAVAVPSMWSDIRSRRSRRCLDDGHYFCSGTTKVKDWRKSANPRKSRKRVKRHRACPSEFDYQGWKVWGRWKRSGKKSIDLYDEFIEDVDAVEKDHYGKKERGMTKDCWNTCDYPSECRWGRQYGVHSPLVQEVPSVALSPVSPPSPTPSNLEGVLKPENVKACEEAEKKGEKTDFWGALLASATRRKSVTRSSPLAVISEEPEGQDRISKDQEGDVTMTGYNYESVSSSIVTATAVAAATAVGNVLADISPVASFKEMTRKTFKQGRLSRILELDETSSPEQHSLSTVTVNHMETGFENRDDLLSEFAPLERMDSACSPGLVS
ncbi:hypothetical protein BU24DRAFT_495251 [Aaosphaeria arxii CBS 175.79]|uniref:Uncharacterized protein n=1 Tax=Aaosphaeria arxii CBS 175.79 TaxID=1450172 RepID=A0A6A5XG22_9PLEO|nr:uncharacterized protein BU24DRAFT_495251 [Aaosphaeria arxii CBS 175.79]KAF2012185.1 hypothetical protein BU24DRAFT_495251 [Aaosphaeria arxii CBS 175.79]